MVKERLRKLRRFLTGAALATLVVVVGAPAASADGVFPAFQLDVIQDGISVWDTEEAPASTTVTDNLDGSFSFKGASDIALFTGELVAIIDGNPGVGIAMQVTNVSSSVIEHPAARPTVTSSANGNVRPRWATG